VLLYRIIQFVKNYLTVPYGTDTDQYCMSVTVMWLVLSGLLRCILTHVYLMSRKESVELWKSRNETDAIGTLLRINISRPSAKIPLILKRSFFRKRVIAIREPPIPREVVLSL
jgi:hypothetical protein